MTKSRQNIDGFVRRRAGQQLGDLHRSKTAPKSQPADRRTQLQSGRSAATTTTLGKRPGVELSRSEISESLKSIDQPTGNAKKRRKSRKRDLGSTQHSRRRKIIKWSVIGLLTIGLLIAGFIGLRAFIASNNIFSGNIFDVLQLQPLKKDANGRSNVLVFGTAEDSEGGTHEGGNLTDSMMVMSIDQETKDAYLISIPRDLWVNYEEQCTVGDAGKINAAYYCASNDGQDEAAGAAATQRLVGEILDMDIQYYAHLNFSVVIDAVDAVGGVDITIESDDPRGILDRNFDWKCNYECYYVNYENGERVTMDGERALAFARARNASGGYGLANGNFDREKNQQKVIKALREKAVSAGTLTDLGKVTGLIDSLGSNLRTNFETKEIRTLMSLGTDIQSDNIQSISLVDEEEPMLTIDNMAGQSIVRPLDGLFSYTSIQNYIKENLSNNPITREKARVAVLNGAASPGLAQREADKLSDVGFVISDVMNAPAGEYAAVEIYQIAEGKTATRAKLEETYGVTVKTTTPPVMVSDGTAFIVILGVER